MERPEDQDNTESAPTEEGAEDTTRHALLKEKQEKAAATLRAMLETTGRKKSEGKKDLVSALAEMGYDVSSLKRAPSAPAVPKEQLADFVTTKLAEIDARLSETHQRDVEYRKAVAKEEAFEAIKDYVSADPDSFPFINAAGAYDAVFNLIQTHVDRGEEPSSEAHAARLVEERLKDLGSKFSALLGSGVRQDGSQAPVTHKSSTTLTNRAAASSSSTRKALHELSHEDAIRAMVEAIGR